MTIPVEPEIEKEEGNLNSCLKPRFQDSYLKTLSEFVFETLSETYI